MRKMGALTRKVDVKSRDGLILFIFIEEYCILHLYEHVCTSHHSFDTCSYYSNVLQVPTCY